MITKEQVDKWNIVAELFNYKIKRMNDGFAVSVSCLIEDNAFHNPAVYAEYIELPDYSQEVKCFRVSYSGFGTIVDESIDSMYFSRLVSAHNMCDLLNEMIIKEKENDGFRPQRNRNV